MAVVMKADDRSIQFDKEKAEMLFGSVAENSLDPNSAKVEFKSAVDYIHLQPQMKVEYSGQTVQLPLDMTLESSASVGFPALEFEYTGKFSQVVHMPKGSGEERAKKLLGNIIKNTGITGLFHRTRDPSASTNLLDELKAPPCEQTLFKTLRFDDAGQVRPYFDGLEYQITFSQQRVCKTGENDEQWDLQISGEMKVSIRPHFSGPTSFEGGLPMPVLAHGGFPPFGGAGRVAIPRVGAAGMGTAAMLAEEAMIAEEVVMIPVII